MKKVISSLLLCILLLLSFTSCMSEIGGVQSDVPEDGSQAGETVQIVRMKKDAKKFQKMTREYVELVEVSSENLPDNVVTDIEKFSVYYAKTDLYAGDYVYKEQISKEIPVESSAEMLRQKIATSKESFVVVSDYIKPNTGEDVQVHLQGLINKNPGKTIYFPDGEYVISSSLVTKSEGKYSTTFFFSDNAVLRAADNWHEKDGNVAMICLGKLNSDGTHVNDATSNGSYFGVFGGTFECNNMAEGISIDSSRESVIYGSCIKDATVGIRIKYGANGGPSDADIENVEIIGNGLSGATGIKIFATDNTISNVKIYDMETGVYAEDPGNTFRSVDIYFSENYEKYNRTIGFHQANSVDFFYDCYVENASTAFRLSEGHGYILDSVSAAWTYAAPSQTAFYFTNNFDSRMTLCRVEFFEGGKKNTFIKVAGSGSGRIDSPIFNTALETDGTYKSYLINGNVIDLSKVQ